MQEQHDPCTRSHQDKLEPKIYRALNTVTVGGPVTGKIVEKEHRVHTYAECHNSRVLILSWENYFYGFL